MVLRLDFQSNKFVDFMDVSNDSMARAEERLSLLFKVTLFHEEVHLHLSVTYNFFCIG